ncbi:MAG TPA: transglycosylase SLT domain-containing protein [Pyrinomonadaceae bacterium]|nr:transglycosylase SLT domain-containing protein [Pyrinomonadaceae bacterium]
MKIRLILGLTLLTMTFSISGISCAFVKPVLTKNSTSESANSKEIQKSKDESPQPQNQKYAQMSEEEKYRLVARKSNEFLDLFPAKNKVNGDEVKPYIDGDGLAAVKEQVDFYFKRISIKSVNSSGCKMSGNLVDVLQRGKAVAPDLSSTFVNNGLPAELGIYIPMIESEFCPCLQAPTGGLGMFQLTTMVGADYGLKTIKGATPKKPDDRCNYKLSAEAVAKYFKKLLAIDFENNSIGVLFAISSYNAGPGGIKLNIKNNNESNSEDFNYWNLRKSILDDPSKGTKQFTEENYKYFPKFLAAWIVGENPKVFGIEMEPLSKK